jgi:hypothetical protein
MPQGLDADYVTGGIDYGQVRRPLPIAKAFKDAILACEMLISVPTAGPAGDPLACATLTIATPGSAGSTPGDLPARAATPSRPVPPSGPVRHSRQQCHSTPADISSGQP